LVLIPREAQPRRFPASAASTAFFSSVRGDVEATSVDGAGGAVNANSSGSIKAWSDLLAPEARSGKTLRGDSSIAKSGDSTAR